MMMQRVNFIAACLFVHHSPLMHHTLSSLCFNYCLLVCARVRACHRSSTKLGRLSAGSYPVHATLGTDGNFKGKGCEWYYHDMMSARVHAMSLQLCTACKDTWLLSRSDGKGSTRVLS